MKQILIIEDNSEVRENLEEILELYGYATEGAENGKTGVQKALTNPPDLILCDIMMPELDGFGVLNILSKKPNTADIPFIFLTAKSEKEDFRRGMNLGADDYITKPYYKDELLNVIETRLKKSERLKKITDGSPDSWNAFINEAKGEEALKKLSSKRTVKFLKKKEMLFQEGNLPRYLYYLDSGKIKMYKINEYGREYIVKIHNEKTFFGFESLIQGGKYSENAAAIESSELRLIPKEDFFTLLYGNRDFAARFIKILANNVLEQEEQLLSLAYNSIRKRVAEALIQLQNLQQGAFIKILREDLANIVGTAKESVIRTLSDFKSEGLINIQNGKIIILNKEKLMTLPN